ncbi:unnamed protein product [Miscanthus lutarioriparius]|uniref:Uncharacterized protein n=1 Tax=Miscanthus lutarioriparius TaxID=422564 RepID=A0A811MLU0_9POAL|nr:unnamed protein product [Miscanthus lutarioriparius]
MHSYHGQSPATHQSPWSLVLPTQKTGDEQPMHGDTGCCGAGAQTRATGSCRRKRRRGARPSSSYDPSVYR